MIARNSFSGMGATTVGNILVRTVPQKANIVCADQSCRTNDSGGATLAVCKCKGVNIMGVTGATQNTNAKRLQHRGSPQ